MRVSSARTLSSLAGLTTAASVVKRVYSNLAVLNITADGFAVRQMAPGISFEALQDVTDAQLRLANQSRSFKARIRRSECQPAADNRQRRGEDRPQYVIRNARADVAANGDPR